MPRNTRTHRMPGPLKDALSVAPAPAVRAAEPIVSLLARASRLTEVLPHLHQHALDATQGTCSLLFEFDPGSGLMQATSGFGLEELVTDPWIPGPPESKLVSDAFARQGPMFVADADRQMPELTERLHTPAVLLLPLIKGSQRTGLLAIGFGTAPVSMASNGDTAGVADTFVAALELFRLRQKDELQADLRELLDQFSASLSATLNLSAGL